MATELELKALVADPGRLRQALLTAGATRGFHGMLRDRRYDRGRELSDAGVILRVRRWQAEDGPAHAELTWKGRSETGADGYKRSEEIECPAGGGDEAARLLEALGYQVVHAIDRYVELLRLGGAVARLEWYPRMDVLVEIEGEPAAMEALIAASGLPRSDCVPDPLTRFTERYQRRTGRPALLDEASLAGERPTWSLA